MDQTTATSTLAANSATADDATGTKPLHTINVNYGSTFDDSAFTAAPMVTPQMAPPPMAAPPMATSQIATAPITQWQQSQSVQRDPAILNKPKAIQEVAPTRQNVECSAEQVVQLMQMMKQEGMNTSNFNFKIV